MSESLNADPKPGYDNMLLCRIQITALHFLDKLHNASTSIMWGCNCWTYSNITLHLRNGTS